jgi:hypothetical protein
MQGERDGEGGGKRERGRERGIERERRQTKLCAHVSVMMCVHVTCDDVRARDGTRSCACMYVLSESGACMSILCVHVRVERVTM